MMNASDMLLELNCEVLEAASGPAALAILEQQKVDIIVTDLGLPGMSGEELARIARTRWPEIAIVFATGNSELPLLPGADTVTLLKKLYGPADLERAIRTVRRRT